jgi:hypothetical protein
MLKKVEDYQEWIIDSFLLINLIGTTVLSSLYHLMQLKRKKMLEKKLNTFTIIKDRCEISLFRIVTDVAHETLIEEIVGVRRLVVGCSLDIHLIAILLQSAFHGIVWCELPTISVYGLNILHVLFSFYLNHGGFPENHNLNINMKLNLNTF